ncbi:MAG: M64 family metallopeptidase [Verrucomicrobiae bacterium]|nr:M64 family metallopeptidase [Verrucomicrobiae bacterium]
MRWRFFLKCARAAALSWWIPVVAAGQGTLSTILSNGPTANRINLVVLSEGYTTNQLAQFLVDATNAVNALLAQMPYQAYRSYFNAFAISVASAQSGADDPRFGISVNTYFNSSFNSYGVGQLLTIPPNNFDSNYANGQGKVDALLAALMPEYDIPLLLVNSPTYGGSGGATIISSLHFDSAEIARHESGHTLGGLADEYVGGAPTGYVPTEKPNSTAQTNRALIKWNVWIATNTPVPTPAIPAYYNVVGLFTGAQYQATGWYRPKFDCKMRSILQGASVPFCEVCSEQLVKSIYTLVSPIESFSPVATNLAVYSTQALQFGVSVLQPLTHNLTIQWFTNGAAVAGATNATFSLLPTALPPGSNRVQVVVRDPTSLVRNDPGGLLSATNTWRLTVSVTDLALMSPLALGDGRFRFTVTGSAPQGFVIQGSSNLITWFSLHTGTLSGGKLDYTNTGLTNVPVRFYRTRSPP